MSSNVQVEFVDPEPEDEGFEVTDEVNADDIGDLSDQKSSDTIEPARGVTFVIKKAVVDVKRSDLLTEEDYGEKPYLYKTLRVEAAVKEPGIAVGEKFLYAKKRFFPEFRLVLNLPAIKLNHTRDERKTKPFNEAWWKSEARLDTKEFMLAVGAAELDEAGHWKMHASINDAFLEQLQDAEFVADVIKEKDGLRPGEFRNALKRFRRAAVADEEAGDE